VQIIAISFAVYALAQTIMCGNKHKNGVKMDKEKVFHMLYGLAEGIANMFGQNCETVVQEIENGKFCNVAIFNGHVSGREVMSTIGILGGVLELENIDFEKAKTGIMNQMVRHPSGKTIKSSSFPFVGEDYYYVLGINYDVTKLELMDSFIESFLSFDGDLFTTLNQKKENTMENLLDSCLSLTGADNRKLKKKERLALIRTLNEKNFFQMQKSVPSLSEKLNVSKYTIYKDLNEIGATDLGQ